MGIVHEPMDDIDAHFVGNTSGNVNSSDNSWDGPMSGHRLKFQKIYQKFKIIMLVFASS